MSDWSGLRALLAGLSVAFVAGVMLTMGMAITTDSTDHVFSLALFSGVVLHALSHFFIARGADRFAGWCVLPAVIIGAIAVGAYLLAFNGLVEPVARFGFRLAGFIHLHLTGALALLLLASGVAVAARRGGRGFGSEALLASSVLSGALMVILYFWQDELTLHADTSQLAHGMLPGEIGVLFGAAILQLLAAGVLRRDGFDFRNRFLPVVVFLVLMIASVHLWLMLLAEEQGSIARQSQATAERLHASLREHMRVRTEALQRMADRMVASEFTDHGAWTSDARSYLRDFNSLSAIGWIDSQGKIRWAINREEDRYMEGEPYAVDPARQELLRAARVSGMNAFTPPTLLRSGGYGQLIAIPMHDGDEYRGALVVGLRFSQLLESQAANVAPDFAVVIEADGETIYSRMHDPVPHPLSSFAVSDVVFTDLGWHIRIWPETRFFARNFLWLPGFMLMLGLLASMLFGFALYQLEMQRRRSISLHRSEQRYRIVAEQTGAVVYDYDVATGQIEWAGAIREIFGATPEEFVNVDLAEWERRLHPDDAARAARELAEAERQVSRYQCEYRFERSGGGYVHVLDRGVFLPGPDGKAERMLGKISDVTERHEFEQQLRYLAHYDQQTNLRNRVWFMEDAVQHIEAQHGRDALVWFVFMDVDRFRAVNETLGHSVGDLLLETIARRLEETVRGRGELSRLGGDEFGVCMQGEGLDRAAIQVFCEELMDVFGQPFEVSEHSLFVTLSVGIACFPRDGSDAQQVIRAAETAMFRAKHHGRNTWTFYEASMSAGARENLEVANALRQALDRREFHLVFQPRVSLSSGRVTGMEALLRWQNEQLGTVSPATFIPIAEETGLIGPIGWYVVEAAAAAAKRIGSERMAGRRIAINVSARQLVYGDFVEELVQRVESAGAAPHWFEVELTESLVMEDPQRARELFVKLHDAGFLISIDDFGTGYSSLSYLKHFPVDHLKIDRSFVMGLPDNADDAAIVTTVISMGNGLGLKLIAEGIETEAQAAFLRAAGCQEAQGYLFARPMSLDELIARLD